MTNIRKGGHSDIPTLTRIWRQAVTATHHFLSPEDIDALEPEVDEGLKHIELWVAESDGVPVAFMGMTPGMIEALFVDPAHFGKGIGTQLVAHAKKTSPSASPLRVDVNEGNPQAHAFYLARGFRQIGRDDTDGSGRPWPIIHLESGLYPLSDSSKNEI